MLKSFKSNPHVVLTRLVGLNIVLDVLAFAIWAMFPAYQWSIYRLGFTIVGFEAIVAAALFTLTLFGLQKRRTWAPKFSVIVTIAQRVFATYVFFPSPAILLTLAWSLAIIYFAIQTIKIQNQHS